MDWTAVQKGREARWGHCWRFVMGVKLSAAASAGGHDDAEADCHRYCGCGYDTADSGAGKRHRAPYGNRLVDAVPRTWLEFAETVGRKVRIAEGNCRRSLAIYIG